MLAGLASFGFIDRRRLLFDAGVSWVPCRKPAGRRPLSVSSQVSGKSFDGIIAHIVPKARDRFNRELAKSRELA